jgi:hypothetical protein
VDGVLDFHFYDYFFQREIPQEGVTNSSGTQWIRNERDHPKDDFPSPKKQKMDQSKNAGQFSGAGPSNRLSDSKGKQVSGGCSQKDQQQPCSDEDSEDEALMMGDLVVPGSEQLRFGNFDPVEIKTVSCITVNVNPQAVINEYGSNFVKYKQDPLVTIEAKNALHGTSKEEFFQLDNMGSKSRSKVLPTIVEDEEEERNGQRAISMSPVKGSQGAPEIDLSSQEEMIQKENQDIDWDLIQKEDGQNSDFI